VTTLKSNRRIPTPFFALLLVLGSALAGALVLIIIVVILPITNGSALLALAASTGTFATFLIWGIRIRRRKDRRRVRNSDAKAQNIPPSIPLVSVPLVASLQSVALVACSDCGHQISRRAVLCPSCGAPQSAASSRSTPASTGLGTPQSGGTNRPELERRRRRRGLVAVSVLLAGGLIYYFSETPSEHDEGTRLLNTKYRDACHDCGPEHDDATRLLNKKYSTSGAEGRSDVGAHSAAATTARPGKARICATNDIDVIDSDTISEIDLPTTTVFEDHGQFQGDQRKADILSLTGKDRRRAGLLTVDPVVLTKKKPCADAGVRMLIGPGMEEQHANASDQHLWTIDDVLEYPIPAAKPAIEIGRLIDDVSITAILLTDAGDPLILPKQEPDDAQCLDEARKIAAHEGARVTGQTVPGLGGLSRVMIQHPAVVELWFGCRLYAFKPDLRFVWAGSAKPPVNVINLIVSAGAFLTGATPQELRQELANCVTHPAFMKEHSLVDSELPDRELRVSKSNARRLLGTVAAAGSRYFGGSVLTHLTSHTERCGRKASTTTPNVKWRTWRRKPLPNAAIRASGKLSSIRRGTAFATARAATGSREASGGWIAIVLGNRGRAIVHPMSDQIVVVWDLETVPDLLAPRGCWTLGWQTGRAGGPGARLPQTSAS
jgi:hypothetical protein